MGAGVQRWWLDDSRFREECEHFLNRPSLPRAIVHERAKKMPIIKELK